MNSITISLTTWETISLIAIVVSSAWAGFGLLLRLINRQLDLRFATLDGKFKELTEQNRREAEGWQRLERDFLGWKAELPIQYVRREDYVRNQTVIEAKLDGLALRIENQYLRGNQNV